MTARRRTKSKPTKKQTSLFGYLADEFRTMFNPAKLPIWMVFLLALIFLFRIPSFFEPYYYGDEMIYLNLGDAIKRGMVLYRDIHDNKPPLLYLTAGIAGNLFWFRAILAIWMMGTTVAFWKLTQALFSKERAIAIIATVVFAIFTTIPLFEGQVANAELFMIGPTIIAFYILLTQKLKPDTLIEAGVFLAVATLFKVPAAFDVGAIVLFWLIGLKWKSNDIGEFFKRIVFLSIGFIAPIALTFLWYWARGALSEYAIAAFLQNFGYLSSWRPDDAQKSFLIRNGPLLLRGVIVMVGSAALYIYRKKLSKPFIFACLWLLVSLFGATLSERPYPHYLIQVVPSMSLLAGILVAKQSIEQSLAIIPLLLMFLAIQRYQFWHYPVYSYYQRFTTYITGGMTKEEYYRDFDINVPRNYKIAEFIRTSSNREDKIFVWGDSPVIYALSKRFPPLRYVATYHINDFSSQQDTLNKIKRAKPIFVVTLPGAPEFRSLNMFLAEKYILINEIEGAKIYKYPNDQMSIVLN